MTKLYSYTSPDFQLFSALHANGEITLSRKEKLITMHWPDGAWCFQANAYVLHLKRKGRAQTTIFQYCTQISPLLRHCHQNNIDLHGISNSSFTLFMNGLKSERDPTRGHLIRESNSSIAIGRRCLDFIEFVGALHGISDLVGPNGKIQAERKEYHVRTRGNKPKVVRYWHHESFPPESPKKKGNAISKTLIDKLNAAVALVSHSSFIKKRRYVMLLLLEITGGRRTEVANITVESVCKAKEDPDHMLELITLKIPGKISARLLPISAYDCNFLLEYIEKNRAPHIRETCGQSKDGGFLLTSSITGKKLENNTITQELALLKKAAKIRSKAHPHMFRHRFITKLYVTLIARHNIQDEGDFRRRVLDDDHIKREILQYTGHRNTDSLDVYIKPALDEYYGALNTLTTIQKLSNFEGLGRALADLQASILNKIPYQTILDKINSIVDEFEAIRDSGLYDDSS